VAETFTGGHIAARIAPLAGAEKAFVKGVVSPTLGELGATETSPAAAAQVAERLARESGASLALAVLVELDAGADRPDFGATICLGLAEGGKSLSRQARLVGGRDWVRTGATELGLDCLRRHLLRLPVDERIDFERR
jgi:nicotinamide-nucleotide amidase